jgi:hypothetical protein
MLYVVVLVGNTPLIARVRIRAAMNAAGSSADIPLKALPEETACLTLVADAEKWLARVKKIVQVCVYVVLLSY